MTYLDANGYVEDVWRLAAAVMRSGWRPNLLVALWRGGALAGVTMHEFFRVAGWEMRHAPLMSASYGGIEKSGEVRFSFAESLVASIRRGEKVLVVDDVFDTGRTIAATRNLLKPTGAEVRSACVYYKPGKNQTALTPDYFQHEVDNGWIVFPHEIAGLSPEQIGEKSALLGDLLKGGVS